MLISQILIDLDQDLFLFLNQGLQNPIFDALMPLFRNKYIWIPLYVFILAFIFFNYRFKIAALYIIAMAVTVGISDYSNSQIVKKTVKRVRPCNDLQIKEDVRLLVPCGSGYSFTSSHASNHFALAVFLIFTLGRVFRGIRWPLIIWASLIAFAQVYVGIHYPMDVISGAVYGFVIGFILAQVYIKAFKKNILEDRELRIEY